MRDNVNGKFVAKTCRGLKVGRVTLVEHIGRRGHNQLWKCKCDCGKVFEALGSNVLRGNTTSCGCYRAQILGNWSRTHGMSTTAIFYLWQSMLRRCYDKNQPAYPSYGGRGITVCDEWHSFERFFADIGSSRPPGLELDRIDNNGNYEPGNCRWTTRKVQARNVRSNALATINGRTLCIAEWAEVSGIPAPRIYARRYLGWPDSDLLRPRNWQPSRHRAQ